MIEDRTFKIAAVLVVVGLALGLAVISNLSYLMASSGSEPEAFFCGPPEGNPPDGRAHGQAHREARGGVGVGDCLDSGGVVFGRIKPQVNY